MFSNTTSKTIDEAPTVIPAEQRADDLDEKEDSAPV